METRLLQRSASEVSVSAGDRLQMTPKDPSRLHVLGNSEPVWKLVGQFLVFQHQPPLVLKAEVHSNPSISIFPRLCPSSSLLWLRALALQRWFVGGCHDWTVWDR